MREEITVARGYKTSRTQCKMAKGRNPCKQLEHLRTQLKNRDRELRAVAPPPVVSLRYACLKFNVIQPRIVKKKKTEIERFKLIIFLTVTCLNESRQQAPRVSNSKLESLT